MALPVRKGYTGAPAQAVLTNSPADSDTSFVVDTVTGWSTSFPFYCVVAPGTSKEEKVKVTAISGVTLTVVRAQDDTSSPLVHSAGSAIYPVFTADEADEANLIASVMTTKGDVIGTDGSTINRLGVGTNTHVLQADSTATNGFKWGTVANANIDASAGIVDTKLATISTAGKVSNSATTATSANTASAIVARDASGNFTAGIISAVTNVAAGRGVGIAADPLDTYSILQFTNNAVTAQLSSLVATTNLLTASTAFEATSFIGPLTGNASSATTASTVSDNAITSAKIADGAVGTAEIALNAVITDRIAVAAVTNDRLNNGVSGDIPLVTVSASAASGGKNGDVWIVV